MLRTTLKSLAAHKLRLALTALAIVLGVAFMAGTFVLTDTVKYTFDSLFAQTAIGKDVVVRGIAPFGTSGGRGGDGTVRPLTPERLLSTIKAVPGVRAVDGHVQGSVSLVGRDGRAVKRQAPVFGASFSLDPSLSPLRVSSGRGPANGDEIAMDRTTAAAQGFHVGDDVTVVTNAGPHGFRLVGVTTFGKTDNLAGASFISFETATAQRLVGKPGFFDEIEVAALPSTSPDKLLTSIGARLNAPDTGGTFEAVSASAAAAQTAKQVEGFLTYFKTFLLIFALISLFVGAFLIANTFSILIGQRTRELALLRALGASRAQVIRSLIGESLVTGVAGSVVGLALGIPLAAGLYALLKAAGLGLPSSSLQILPRTVIVSLIAGTLMTLLSAVGPSVRASRIPPVAAMREDATLVETSLRRRAVVGIVLLASGLVALAVGLFAGLKRPLPLVGLGAPLIFVGVAVLAPFVAGRLAEIIGAPLPRVAGITGRLGQANAARNPRRTAATASALMVGLAVVAAIATLGSSLTASFSSIIDRSIRADYVLTADGFQGMSPGVKDLVARQSGITAFTPYSEITWHEGAASKQAAGIDPTTGAQLLTLSMVTGSAEALARGNVLVDDKVARDRRLKVGDVVQMGFAARGRTPVPTVVGGTYKTNQFLDNYLLSYDTVVADSTQSQDQAIFVKVGDPSSGAALRAAARSYPDVKVQTATQFKDARKKRFNQFLVIVYVLLALSIVIAAFSVVNTMALSVIERTREIGLLRSIGMGRRQVRGMIRGEAVIVSLLGAVLGVILGVGLGSAMVAALHRSGINVLVIPVPTVLVVLVIAALIGILAAVFPARRAARLDVLRAIATA
ncbi:MAG: ABC transporter permease [Acidimicrobiales bacterium]